MVEIRRALPRTIVLIDGALGRIFGIRRRIRAVCARTRTRAAASRSVLTSIAVVCAPVADIMVLITLTCPTAVKQIRAAGIRACVTRESVRDTRACALSELTCRACAVAARRALASARMENVEELTCIA